MPFLKDWYSQAAFDNEFEMKFSIESIFNTSKLIDFLRKKKVQ